MDIRILPGNIANMIAAGEVVQRPASVVKELMENAVDAGATQVSVILTDAGRTLIQVIDNGCGMTPDEAVLCFERHATSKIATAEDLNDITTFGFRGEALASIAAVAEVTLKTRRPDDEVGCKVEFAASVHLSTDEVSTPAGSNFAVRNLFYNVPARRKFLKSDNVEFKHVAEEFTRVALTRPETGFTLIHNEREIYALKPAKSLKFRIQDLLGNNVVSQVVDISAETSVVRVKGYVGRPDQARKTLGNQFFFVNGRYFRSPYFHKAVMNAFERMIAVGMQVPYFIYFTVPAGDIDVNIHPTKTEIKFENEQAIWQILTAAVNDSIGKFCDIPSINFDTEGQPEIPLYDPSVNIAPPRPQYNPSYNPFETSSSSHKDKVIDQWEELYKGLHSGDVIAPDVQESSSDLFESSGVYSQPTEGVVKSKIGTTLEERSPSHYQYKGKYVMTAVKSGLMIIDQNRADIRIRYERFIQQMEQEASRTQKVLFPEVVQFAPSTKVMVVKLLPYLQKVGFDLTDLGGNSFSVNGVPAGLEGIDSVALLQEIVADAVEKGCTSATDIHSTLALGMARRSAVTYGEVLGNDEMETLVNDLFATSNVNYTPDGKTILCILPQRDIEQLLN